MQQRKQIQTNLASDGRSNLPSEHVVRPLLHSSRLLMWTQGLWLTDLMAICSCAHAIALSMGIVQ